LADAIPWRSRWTRIAGRRDEDAQPSTPAAEDKASDYTVLGDTVNVAARLQGEAAAGEILISQETYSPVASEYPAATRRELLLKGKSEPVVAWQVETKPVPTRRTSD